ncbi:MAG: PQQ-binding-like beta-propeller repeat protein, partial [Planctomycetes bacterium]|nr:PQQ-binding-like beta-propeller repeat protein [Planctomycetota bacterium]
VAWIHAAENSVSPNAIAIQNKRLFMIDRVSHAEVERGKKRGEKIPVTSVLKALDLASGQELWQTKEELKGKMLWMGDGVLLVTGGGPYKSAYSAQDGKPLWAERLPGIPYPVIIGNTFYAYPRAYDLRTGEPKTRVDPLPARPFPGPWDASRAAAQSRAARPCCSSEQRPRAFAIWQTTAARTGSDRFGRAAGSTRSPPAAWCSCRRVPAAARAPTISRPLSR